MTEQPDAPLDDLDETILGQVRAAFAGVDPPPADLDDRVRFAIDLERVDFEVSRLYEDVVAGAGARAGERLRTVTFEADRLTVMLTVAEAGQDRLRLEGWLAPPGALRVTLRHGGDLGAAAGAAGGDRETVTDGTGRFVFEEVPPGLAQLVVHQPPGAPLVTSPIRL